jgi:hypothetical protein
MDETLREMVQRNPFQPFQLRLTNGESHIVRRPEQVMMLKSRFVVSWPKEDRFIYCDVSEIESIQPIPKKRSAK